MDREQAGPRNSSLDANDRDVHIGTPSDDGAFEALPPRASSNTLKLGAGAGLSVISALLAACGSGGTTSTPATGGTTVDGTNTGTLPGDMTPAPGPAPGPSPVAPPAAPPTLKQVSRFLAQATAGATKEEILRTQQIGFPAWIEEQFQTTAATKHWDRLVEKGFNVLANKNNSQGIDDSLWRRLLHSNDQLRVRIALAFSEIFVVGIDGLSMSFKQFAAAHYMDILERNAFGTYRKLLEEISTSTAMGVYLSHRGNNKANAATGRLPDENYAREVMQLFSIGLIELNADGTPKLAAGKPIETYDPDDVSGLARVFTGWDYDSTDADTPERNQRPMVNTASRHETQEKKFLGITIASGADGPTSLSLALDTLVNHPNTGPFIARQLIQRLVTSNPSTAYVGRVASVFNSTKNVGGDFKALIRAILLDDEARADSFISSSQSGKVREPMLRFTQWARVFKTTATSGTGNIGSTADPATKLSQSPLRSPSVFNFFRPGYVPPGTALGTGGLVAPELQIANESSMVGYVNFMQSAIENKRTDITVDYSGWLAMTSDSQVLLDELNLIFAAGQISSTTISTIKVAIDTISTATVVGQQNRLYAAIMLVMACPEYLVQK